jgi:hypothetical protein
MIFGIKIDPKLLILLVVCVVLLSLIAIEGFAQYKSYTDMLRAKYGLSSSASMTASEYARRLEWEQDNLSYKSKLYDDLRSGKMTWAQVQQLTASVGAKLAKTGSYRRDITDYRINPSDSPDWNPETNRYNYKYETVYTTDKLQYINQPTFDEDLRLTGGKRLSQCAPDDLNCMRYMTAANGSKPWSFISTGGGAADPYDAPNLLSTLNSSPATMSTTAAGFPTTAAGFPTTPSTAGPITPPGGSPSSFDRCVSACLIFNYGEEPYSDENKTYCISRCKSMNR